MNTSEEAALLEGLGAGASSDDEANMVTEEILFREFDANGGKPISPEDLENCLGQMAASHEHDQRLVDNPISRSIEMVVSSFYVH